MSDAVQIKQAREAVKLAQQALQLCERALANLEPAPAPAPPPGWDHMIEPAERDALKRIVQAQREMMPHDPELAEIDSQLAAAKGGYLALYGSKLERLLEICRPPARTSEGLLFRRLVARIGAAQS